MIREARSFWHDSSARVSAAAGLCFLALATARAIRVPLTYDEAAAYVRFIATDAPSVFNTNALSPFSFEVATNHLLSTVLTKLCSVVAGSGAIVLRMPSLLGYALFLICSLLILHRNARGVIAIAGFVLLNMNPYLLDYFALSRGYGLSLGLMMASVLYLFRWIRPARDGDDSRRDLVLTLLFACGAAAANFSLLNVYLGILAVVLATLVGSRKKGTPALIGGEAVQLRLRDVFVWLLVAAAFTSVVLSQDVNLSEKIYEPVSVKLAGLEPRELDAVKAFRIDIRGRDTPLIRDAGDSGWHARRPSHFRGIRVELPPAVAAKVQLVAVVVGNRAFSSNLRQEDLWRVHEEGTTRVLESGPALSLPKPRMPAFATVMNWAGRARYVATLATAVALALLALVGLAAALWLAGLVVVRARVLTADESKTIAVAVLWLATFTATPLYLLRRDAQLYYGGTRGLIEDTFRSLVEGSFYGKAYHPAQIQIVYAAILFTLAAFGVMLVLSRRELLRQRMFPPTVLLAIMSVASMSVVVQALTFGTPYLLGRTALFYIPLYVLFATFLCEAVSKWSRSSAAALAPVSRQAKAIGRSLAAVAVVCSAYHFATTVNFNSTWDWPDDADTKRMMGDLARTLSEAGPPERRAVLGVDWIYSPVATYYARRNGPAAIEVVVLPNPRADYVYVGDRRVAASARVIRTYRLSHTVLARLVAAPTSR